MLFLYIAGGLSVMTALASGFFHVKEDASKRLVCKLIASLLFCAVGFAALYIKGSFSAYGIFVMAALVLGLLGDIFLCMKGLAADNKVMFFNAIGFFCFMMGHIAFATIFLSVVKFKLYILPVMLAGIVAPGLLMLFKVLNARKLNIALLIYGAVIGVMVMAAVNIYANYPGTTVGALSLTAAILFAVSDLTLSVREFGNFKNKAPLIFIVLSTYYIAQCLFAITIVFH